MKRLFSVLFNTKGLVGAALGFITMLAPSFALADDLNSYLGGYLLATIIDDEAEILSIGVTPDWQ